MSICRSGRGPGAADAASRGQRVLSRALLLILMAALAATAALAAAAGCGNEDQQRQAVEATEAVQSAAGPEPHLAPAPGPPDGPAGEDGFEDERITGDLGDRRFVLRAWNGEEAAPASTEITLALRDGRLAGHSGCNEYVAVVKSGTEPGRLRVDSVATTKKACPEPQMAAETRFLEQLEQVHGYELRGDRLLLHFGPADSPGTMEFVSP
ncbi:MAG: META domain-containing protein [Candidatus Krumholzibacteriia bacterium]